MFSFSPPTSQLVWSLVIFSFSLLYDVTLIFLGLWVTLSFLSTFIIKLVRDFYFFFLTGICSFLLKLMLEKAVHSDLFHRYLLI